MPNRLHQKTLFVVPVTLSSTLRKRLASKGLKMTPSLNGPSLPLLYSSRTKKQEGDGKMLSNGVRWRRTGGGDCSE